MYSYRSLADRMDAHDIPLALPIQPVSFETPLEQAAGEAYVGSGVSRSPASIPEVPISELQIPVDLMEPMEPMNSDGPVYDSMPSTFDVITKQILSGRELSNYDQHRLSDSSEPSQALQDGFGVWNNINPLPELRDNPVLRAEKPIIVDSLEYQTDALVYDSVNSAEPKLIRFDYGPFIQRKILFPKSRVN